jgi:hypothetical protein
MIILVPVQTAVWSVRADGALAAAMLVQVSVVGLYRAASVRGVPPLSPPQISISEPVQTAVWNRRLVGAPFVDIDDQVSEIGLYRAPLLRETEPSYPPQTIICSPVHMDV